jgi:ketosteroid isomerase-like protein
VSKRYLTMLFPLLAVAAVGQGCGAGPNSDSVADRIRGIEGQRLRALVTQDMEVARRLHAEDFQLFTPDGTEFTKESYLGLIESGQLDYRVWDAGEIRLRLYGDVAVIRYDDSAFEVYVDGQPARSGRLRHTNLYEKRDGRWQVVWSHASGGQPGHE